MRQVLWLLPLVLVLPALKVLLVPRLRGRVGEARVSAVLDRIGTETLHDIILPDGRDRGGPIAGVSSRIVASQDPELTLHLHDPVPQRQPGDPWPARELPPGPAGVMGQGDSRALACRAGCLLAEAPHGYAVPVSENRGQRCRQRFPRGW